MALLLLIILLYGAVHLVFVQNFLTTKITGILSEKLNTTVKIDHINFSFYDKLDLRGLLVKDHNKDTLLYAGSAKINITDWFFFRDKVVLKYASLSDAQVNMHRTDSVWNYQFLLDYFASPAKSNKKDKVQFDVKEIHLTNIQFYQVDKWVGKDQIGFVKKMDLLADTMDFNKKRIWIKSIYFDEPFFQISDYTGNRDKLGLTVAKKKIIPLPNALRWNPDGWVMNLKNLHIQNGTFVNDTETDRTAYTDQFDGSHLRFSNINGNLNNIHFEKDTLVTDGNLTTKERSGFEVKKLQAQIKFTPEIMEFNQLELVTNKSRLGNYYAMKYQSFNEDMGHFLHNVKLEGNFINSEINSDDLAFFAPELKTWKRVLKIKGFAKGTIDNLSAKKMLLQSGNSIVDGDLVMQGLPDICLLYTSPSPRD